MMDFLRKHMRTIFLITIAGFLVGTFVGFGGYFFSDRRDIVAKVNGVDITTRSYNQMFSRVQENLRNQKVEVTDQILKQQKRAVLQNLIQEEVFTQEAKKYGINISDAELASSIHQYPAFQRDGRFDQNTYFTILMQQLHLTPQEFEETQRRQMAVYKLRYLIASSVKISEPELQYEYARANKGNMKNFDKERDKFLEQLTNEKVNYAFADWFRQLNQSLKVKIYLKDEAAS